MAAAVARSLLPFRKSASSPTSAYLYISKRLFSSASSSMAKPSLLPFGFSPPIRSTTSLSHSLRFINNSASPPSFRGHDLLRSNNGHVRFYRGSRMKERSKKLSFKEGFITYRAKRTGIPRHRKARVIGVSHNDIRFGEFALRALETTRIKPGELQSSRRAMSRCARHDGRERLWIRKPADRRNGRGRSSPAIWMPVVKPGRILYDVDGFKEENVARTAKSLAAWIKKEKETGLRR